MVKFDIEIDMTIVYFEILWPGWTLGKKKYSKKYFGKKREKKFKCDECSYAATDKHKLKRHKQIHNTTKDFRCDICDLAFNTGEKLRKDSTNNSYCVEYLGR